jgi:hypothetical protein
MSQTCAFKLFPATGCAGIACHKARQLAWCPSWLHKQVMTKLAAGGKVAGELKS